MKDASPHEGAKKHTTKAKLCGAKTRGREDDGTPKRCRRPGTGTGGRCRLHGGASLTGQDAGAFKHGRRSKYLVGAALARYTDALDDPDLLKIRQDAALAESLLTALTATLPKRGVQSEQLERRILNIVDKRRALIESEARRLVQLQQMVTLAQFMATMKAVAELIREFVTDDKQRAEFQRRLQQMLLAQPVTGGGDGGGEDDG